MMSNDKGHTDKKIEPTDNNEHTDSNRHLDNETTDEASTFSDCSSENGNSNKQVLSDSDYSSDSGHDNDYISKTPSNSFPESDRTGDSNYSSLDHLSYHDSDGISTELSSSDLRSSVHGTNHPSLDSLSGYDSDWISKTLSSDVTSSHYSSEGTNVIKGVTRGCEADHDGKAKSSFVGNNSVGKKCTDVKLNLSKLTGVTKPVESDKMKKTIPSHKRTKKEYPRTETIKQRLSGHIPPDSRYNAPYTNDTINRSLTTEEISEILAKYMVKRDVKEVVAELNNLATIDDIDDSIASVKDCLKNLKSKLDDHLTDKMIAKRDTNHQQSDIDWLFLYENFMSDTDQKYSVLKNPKKEIKDCLHCHDGPVVRQDLIVMHSTMDSADPSATENSNQENQTEGQGVEADAPADAAGQEVQVAELFEDAGSIYNNQGNPEEYLTQLVSEEEGAREKTEMVLEVSGPFKLPKRSELVTFSSCSYYSTHHAEDQHMTSMEIQYQRFSKILAAKGVSVETIMQFVYATVGNIPTWESHIAELLSSIVVVINNAEDVLAIGNICKWLPEIIQQALKLPETRPVPVTETEERVPFTAPLASASYMCNRSCRGLRDFRPSETTCATLRNHSRASVNPPADDFKETCHPLQDTDDDLDYADPDSANLIAYHYYHSAPACDATEVEVYELCGYSYHCRMCGVFMCQGERIVMEINAQLDRIRHSMQRDDLLATLTAAVNSNTSQNCILGFLRSHIPLEMLQRNLMLGCQEPLPVVKCAVDPMTLSRVRDSINSFINSHHTTISSFVGTCQSPVSQPDVSLHTTVIREGSVLLANMLNWIDTSFNQSVLQPFVRAITASRHLPLHNEYMQRILSGLLSSRLPNTSSSKLSISVTVVPNDVSINVDQFTSGLMEKHIACRQQDGIFGLLRLPPVDTVSNAPLTVMWTVTIQSPNLQQVDFQFVDPVEAVNQNNRESLVNALQSTYSYHGEVQNDGFVEDYNSFVDSPFSDPSDWNKTTQLDIFSYFPAENTSYIHHPSYPDTIANNNQVNCEAQEATISDDSSDSETED